MSKTLVIVESPAKARTINQYLNSDYIVKSSIGHIRDLPKSNNKNKVVLNAKKSKKNKLDKKTALIKRMGIDPYNDWKADYQIIPGKEKIVAELKTLAKKVDKIYLATDLDREGEAIAWHLQEIIGNNDKFSRIIFNEITKNKILKAFENPVKLNINKVYAQQARRFMDRIVGYMLSPLLWKKIARGLSAGRVQSVVVRLIVEREHKIKTFVPKEFWKTRGNFVTLKNEELQMEVTHFNKEVFSPINQIDIEKHIKILEQLSYKIINKERKTTYLKAPAPYITSTLQQDANIHLGFSVKKTMLIAQRLYEAGHITYMRTDSTSISKEAIENVRNYIKTRFGEIYLPKYHINYCNKQNSQEAHEAIRPSNIELLLDDLETIEPEAKKLYKLIWHQFIACQMMQACYELITITATAGQYRLQSKSRKLDFDGWLRILPNRKHESHKIIDVNIGDIINLKKLIPSQHFTKPLPRFNEASLVKELEKLNIGRPSTYSTIISTIQERGYIKIENNRFYVEKIGKIVTDSLKRNFHELISYDFSAQMENTLDQIANNQVEWKTVLNTFFNNFIKQFNIAEKNPLEGGMQLNNIVLISINCSICGRMMGIRTGSTGVFLGCSGYSLTLKNRCKNTINLILENEIINVEKQKNIEINNNMINKYCQKCNTPMDCYITTNSKYKIYICGNNPRCDGYNIEKGQFYIKGIEQLIINCEKCGSKMDLKLGRFGKYMSCISCKNIRKILKDGNIAPPAEDPVPLPELLCKKSNDYFVLRNSATGVFLSASTFPKLRETRAPLVEELKRFSDRLPSSLQYLADAPSTDPEGNKTVIRYSYNKKQQYVSSKKKGKITNWSAFYTQGKWQENKN
ncbi:type I DNA topoisomerase [Candidatus Pantoea edessiphila]|uniref:DNA topoisomerase 1 n=1 Tax=Candidatus Pantoea edessiphila TaxID=2044610 RepID=A0A2P5SWT6_9GAMM|nr:type I DNA topoisomerase [Candidatus Pantoea edessiphila]PPI86784.1 DNA topoisomerase I subunit omega [Candidatus Pantoea edessiphila]